MDRNSTLPLRTGNRIPVMGLGTWQLTDDTAATIAYALELGFPMIDTSGDYGTQPGIGEGVRRWGGDRKDLYLVTKVEETDDSYEKTKRDLDELGFEYADMMLIHRPPPSGAGEKLWEGLIRAREDGLTRDIGVSNYPAALIDRLIEATGEAPALNQIEWSPFGHSEEMVRYAREKRMAIQGYSPLTRTERLGDPLLGRIGERHGKSPAQVLIRWGLQRGTCPIPKANRRDHLEEDIAVFDFELGEDEMAALNGRNERYSALGELPYE